MRIRSFDPLTLGIMDSPYYVAYSGGKDSDAIRILFELSGVRYELVHNHTTIDAPETVRYVRAIPNIQISYPELSMWKLIVKTGIPPTRKMRYCCSYLKEHGGESRFVVTGVRWSESVRRKAIRTGLEVKHNNPQKSLFLNVDNDESRMMLETCKLKGKRILNPIVDWTDDDVWEFLNNYGCESNPLYQCGYKRVGCVGCPLAGPKLQKKAFERYPTFEQNYIRAFDRMLEKRQRIVKNTYGWETGQDVMNWWISDSVKKEINPDQLSFWDSEPKQEI